MYSIGNNYSYSPKNQSCVRQNEHKVNSDVPFGNYYQNYEDNDSNFTKTLFLAGILEAVTFGVKKVSQWCADKLNSGREFTSGKNISEMINLMKRKNNLKVNVFSVNNINIGNFGNLSGTKILQDVADGKNAFYMNSIKSVFIPSTKPSLALHELGHAVNSTKVFTTALQKLRNLSHHAPTAILLACALQGSIQDAKNVYQMRNNPDGKNEKNKNFIAKHAGAIGFATMLPTIIEEGIASLRGINAAKMVLGKAKEINILKRNYFFAWCTYLLSGICVGLISKETIIQNSNGFNYNNR